MVHPQEIPLVFRTVDGTLLPTRAFQPLVDEARAAHEHGTAKLAALVEQAARQAQEV